MLTPVEGSGLAMPKVVLLGAEGPLAVDLQETCNRLGVEIVAALCALDRPSRLRGLRARQIDDAGPGLRGLPCASCAFSPEARHFQFGRAEAQGLEPAEALLDPTAIVSSTVRVGRGTWLNAAVVVGGESYIGDYVFINRSASLGHHALIGDGASVAPGVVIAGNIRIGRDAVIGAGATVLPHVRIGDRAVVAAGAVVRQDVPDDGFVAGVPAVAKPFDRRRSGFNERDGE